LNQPDWSEDRRFKDSLNRWRHRAELDELIGQATPEWDAHELMDRLQTAGVAAGAVLDSKDLLFNPHLLERGFFEVVAHHPSTGIPPLPYVGRPWKMSLTPPVPAKAGPIMGEHNQLVLSELLGRSAAEMASLEEEGVIGYAPTSPRPVSRPSLDEQVRQGRMQRYETDFREQVARVFPPPDNT